MKRDRLRHFLIVFDAKTGRDADVREFRRPTPALLAYRDEEERQRSKPWIQVVLVAADSLETVQRTHSNYWPSVAWSDLKSLLQNVESVIAQPRARRTRSRSARRSRTAR